MPASSVRLDKETKEKLDLLRIHPRESYDAIIRRLADPRIDEELLTDEDREEIDKALMDIRKGRYYTHEQVKEELGLS
jgi:predicted transcriptional regulator